MKRNRETLRVRSQLAALAGALSLALPAAAQQITIKEGHATIKSGMDHWAFTLKEAVEKRTGGRVKIDVFPGGQLGQQTALIQGAQLGTIELVQVATEQMTVLDPRFNIFASPGVFDDVEHADRTFHDPVFQKEVLSITEEKNIRIIGIACESLSEYASREPIRTLADFKGKKFRVLGTRTETEIMRRVGATGVPMQLGEALPALQQRAIDGVRAGIVVFVPFKFVTVAPNVLRSGESIICVPKLASKRWLEGLPGEIRTVILEESAKAEKANVAWNIATMNRMYGAWKAQGGALYELSTGEKAEFRKRLSTTGEDLFKSEPAVLKAYQVLKAAADRARTP
ncbi:MAG: TRAP transporter substrate-binding protein [Burkholderiales bacterium]|nr:TRAP transporter substrate-binding protein [Burkholderiales bacterium]